MFDFHCAEWGFESRFGWWYFIMITQKFSISVIYSSWCTYHTLLPSACSMYNNSNMYADINYITPYIFIHMTTWMCWTCSWSWVWLIMPNRCIPNFILKILCFFLVSRFSRSYNNTYSNHQCLLHHSHHCHCRCHHCCYQHHNHHHPPPGLYIDF